MEISDGYVSYVYLDLSLQNHIVVFHTHYPSLSLEMSMRHAFLHPCLVSTKSSLVPSFRTYGSNILDDYALCIDAVGCPFALP
jgi:hypothetical protein